MSSHRFSAIKIFSPEIFVSILMLNRIVNKKSAVAGKIGIISVCPEEGKGQAALPGRRRRTAGRTVAGISERAGQEAQSGLINYLKGLIIE